MSMILFDVKAHSSALDYFGYNLVNEDCIVVYKNNPVGYVYRSVNKDDVDRGLKGDLSLGTLANSFKDPDVPAETCTLVFPQTPGVTAAEITIGNNKPFVVPVIESSVYKERIQTFSMQGFWNSFADSGFTDDRIEAEIPLVTDGIYRSYAW